jgi:phosphohistidine phosphatase
MQTAYEEGVVHLQLYLLRHGDSGKSVSAAKISSVDRSGVDAPLTVTGKQDIEITARSLKVLKLKFTAILTSPLKRALQTAKITAKIMGAEKELSICDELAPEGDRLKLYDRLRSLSQESSVLVIGHEPYLTNLICDVVLQKTKVRTVGSINLKKSGLAKIRVISLSPNARGELRWLLTPRILRSLSDSSSKVR